MHVVKSDFSVHVCNLPDNEVRNANNDPKVSSDENKSFIIKTFGIEQQRKQVFYLNANFSVMFLS